MYRDFKQKKSKNPCSFVGIIGEYGNLQISFFKWSEIESDFGFRSKLNLFISYFICDKPELVRI